MKVIESVAGKIAAVLEDWGAESGDPILNDICKAAGIPDTLVIGCIDPDRKKVFPGKIAGGICYKDERAFHEDEEAICYIPYGGITNDNDYTEKHSYSRLDLYDLVKAYADRAGGLTHVDQMTDDLFDALNWQFPESIIDQWASIAP